MKSESMEIKIIVMVYTYINLLISKTLLIKELFIKEVQKNFMEHAHFHLN